MATIIDSFGEPRTHIAVRGAGDDSMIARVAHLGGPCPVALQHEEDGWVECVLDVGHADECVLV